MRSWPGVYQPPTLSGVNHPPLRLLDSYSKENVELTSQTFTSYVCGITPYDATHLGHAATYLTFDLVHRYQSAAGKSIELTQNITDIDDPLLERAKRDGQDWKSLALSQIALFRDDMTELRVIPPNHYLGVVESMPQIIAHIEQLVATGDCYLIDNDLYLDIGAIPGSLSNLPIPLDRAIKIFQERGGDPARPGKRHPLDTLLWLGARAGEPSWDSPFGKGRPGWHIECVAIALSTLVNPAAETGSLITLQGGGSDLFFPHHFMTGVQARALSGRNFADLYLHAGMISWQGEKMSKSKGNLVFVSKLLKEGWNGAEIRWALIDRNLFEDFEWHQQSLSRARASINRLSASLAREEVAPTRGVVAEIVEALASGLNTTKAFQAINQWCSNTEAGNSGGQAGEISRALDLYLGIAL